MEKRKKLNFKTVFILLIVTVFLTGATKVTLDAPITLDVKGMDILDVLKIISMRSGLSIATSPLVRGKVSIFLKDVSVWDAFEILMAANNLAYEKMGNMVTVMTNKEYEEKYGKPFYDLRILKRYNLTHARADVVGKTLEELKSKIGKVIVDTYANAVIVIDTPDVIYQMDKVVKGLDLPLVTKVIQLNYAKADTLKEKIADLITPDVGTIKFDQESNRIVVTDLPQKVDQVEKIVRAFDKRPKAVLIEAKILKITLNDEYRYGVDWGAVFGKEAGISYSGTLPSDVGGLGKIAIGEVVFNETQSLTTKHQYRGLFKLFSTFGKTDVLSSPRINVLDGQEAYVLVGTREPVVSVEIIHSDGSQTETESVEYVETGVKLSVTPHISDDGYIRMKIKPEVSSAELITTNRGSQYPQKTVSESETTVIVRDGQTIVLAGLMKEERQKDIEKVPGLGDIPVVGKLFSGKYEKSEKTELVILLTPHISGEMKPEEIEKFMPKEQKAEITSPSEAEKKLMKKEMKKKAEKVMAEQSERKVYSEYYLQVTQRLYDYIQRNYIDLGLKGEVNVVFLIDKNGNLVGEPAVIGDVEPAIRDLAIEVVKKASPYPSFPEGLKKGKEAFNILLSF
ncbi:MAG: hypothetical protein J7J54_05315 [Candidatus Omnitrophica bacterium]|nr:hypothetical protein [Candidatus Omnitrophota bacterium]